MGTDAPPPLDPEPPSLEDARVVRARALGLGRFADVLADIGAGRGFAAFKRLLKLRRTPLQRADRNAIEAALDDPRLFIEPMQGNVGLGRLNGFGAGMYGSRAYDASDGTYVATRCASAFWIPVFPIDQWLVRKADGGGWYFLGRVPLGLAARRLRLAAIGAAAAIAATVAICIAWANSHAELQLLNGLDVPAEVTIDDAPTVSVPSGGRRTVGVSSGRHRLRCTVGGRVVDERTESVSGTADLVSYNVAGAAPLCIVNVAYYAEGRGTRDGDEGSKPQPELLAGRVFVQREGVHDVFEEPPKSVSMSSGQTRLVRHVATVVRGGWRGSVALFDERNNDAGAADVAESVALAQPQDAKLVEEATEISRTRRSPQDHAKFLERLDAAQAQGGGPR